jgi:hypothetical protein
MIACPSTTRATVIAIENKHEIEFCGFRLDYLHDSLVRGGLEGAQHRTASMAGD